MVVVNTKRVWLGALAGWVVWMVWSAFVNLVVLMPRYVAAQKAGAMLAQPRYPFFMPAWFVLLFVLAVICAWLYAGVRATRGPGPKTAFCVGARVGFASGFPIAFSLAAWAPFGAILATLVAGYLYRE
jgi:hypothetical protein